MSGNIPASSDDISRTIGLDRRAVARRRRRKQILLVVVLALLGLAAWGYSTREATPIQYQSAAVQRGALTVTVTATGTLQPVTQVDVGTEISGTVEAVNVDFNDRVKRGQILARLDTEQLTAKLRQSQAALALAQAKVKDADATVIETRLRFNRLQSLEAKGMSSKDERDAAQAAFARARAGLSVANAQVVQANAQVDADRTTLDKTEIRSPIDGIVLRRQVEPGQTVAASLQTPVLFTLAENLAQMELDVAVDEADVGKVKQGQKANFSVDAFPQRTFPAVIHQVRYAPQTVQGVVTYETVLLVDNSDLALRPGMTATVDIVVQRLQNVLLVPNAALRFTPPKSAPQTARAGGSLLGRLFSRRKRTRNPVARETSPAKRDHKRVWTLRDGQPVALDVRVGASDGQMTEVLSGPVKAGTELLVDVSRTGK